MVIKYAKKKGRLTLLAMMLGLTLVAAVFLASGLLPRLPANKYMRDYVFRRCGEFGLWCIGRVGGVRLK